MGDTASDFAFPDPGDPLTKGLTKRELAAIEIMAAMASGSMVALDVCARKAVQAADLLFLELGKKS